jgi:hypothetical protein
MLGKIFAMNDEGCCSACKLLLSFHHNNLLLFLHSSNFFDFSSHSDGGGANDKNIFINVWLGLVIFQIALFIFISQLAKNLSKNWQHWGKGRKYGMINRGPSLLAVI